MNKGYYITGTDTGIGKTVASCAMLEALRARGRRAIGMKPVASGCEYIEGRWRNADALALIEASASKHSYERHNPFAFPAATAPQLAAREVDQEVSLELILNAHASLSADADVIVVEGVGGWAAPLSNELEQSHIAIALDLPIVLVVGLRLGCLSHARLTARAIQQEGCRLVGWIANSIDPDFDRQDDYLRLLRDAFIAPCIGVLPFAPNLDRRDFADRLNLELILP